MRPIKRRATAAFVFLLMTLGATTANADPSPRSEAQISVAFSADCTDFVATSSKDISFVEIHFADGTGVTDESMASPDYAYQGTAILTSVVVKSGTTTLAFTCAVLPPDPGLD